MRLLLRRTSIRSDSGQGLFHKVQPVLPPEHFVAHEKGRRTKNSSGNRLGGVFLETVFHGLVGNLRHELRRIKTRIHQHRTVRGSEFCAREKLTRLVWAGFIERARHGHTEYSPSDFRAQIGPTSAVVTLLDGAPATRWASIDAALTSLGVRWRNRPSSPTLIAATLRHLKAQACPGGASFTLRDGYIEMQNGADCGPLAGTFDVGSVEGLDPISATSTMFDAVQSRCAARDLIRVMRRGATEAITVPCAAGLATPVAYDLTETPPITLPPT